ncbi:MAG: 3-hydroxybutyryl-CoA dehydrogenase [Deltaproteobacteria bacterium]|nr:3-hydroxybutyryl-CoA dehydrogenase [Deltaproteobacteria bacterium]
MNDVHAIGIVGAGLMGTGIAEVAAAAGFQTVLVKATPGFPDDAKRRIEKSLDRAVERTKLTPEARDATLGRITFTTEREALEKSDLIIESIVEDLPSKRALFAALDRVVTPRAIFASNTSTLRITDIAKGCGREDRTIGLHFFSPVPAMQLVELAYTQVTCPSVAKKAGEFVAKLGKTAVPVLDSTGFVVNRLLVPYLIGAISAYEQGLARPEEIDTAMRLGCGHPVGPLALSDLIGLDIVYAMAKLLFADFRDQRYRPPALLRRLVMQNRLGKKTLRGIYDYTASPPKADEELWQLVRGGAFLTSEETAEEDAA